MSSSTSRATVAALIAVLLFAAVTVLRFSTESVGDGYSLLYVLPIAVAAMEFGRVGGLAASTLALTLVGIWDQIGDAGLSFAGYLTLAVAFYVLGAVVGFERDRLHRLDRSRQELLARMEAMARTDELTGLLNRRAWDEALRQEMARAAREGSRHSVALLDLDRFKDYNDRNGHPAGDQLLKQAAYAWRTHLRVTDTLARYGGEEFAVLLPGCPPTNAPETLERLRRATPMGQTVSAGIAAWDGVETAEALIDRADRALYAAKRQGRDRCVIAAD
jgi:diguanylate cyclase (GGDEF)-like protein